MAAWDSEKPWAMILSNNSPPEHTSITKKKNFLSSNVSYNFTMFGWSMLFMMSISLKNALVSACRNEDLSTCFTARAAPSTFRWAMKTTPCVPSPNLLPTSYLSDKAPSACLMKEARPVLFLLTEAPSSLDTMLIVLIAEPRRPSSSELSLAVSLNPTPFALVGFAATGPGSVPLLSESFSGGSGWGFVCPDSRPQRAPMAMPTPRRRLPH
mmetsp:Transcript_22515/g.67520  ORF Transcript_22515/g.67520 Transcript_22515/m.67520 type:complete len:211 (-) Transcript_22515:24-656(-)